MVGDSLDDIYKYLKNYAVLVSNPASMIMQTVAQNFLSSRDGKFARFGHKVGDCYSGSLPHLAPKPGWFIYPAFIGDMTGFYIHSCIHSSDVEAMSFLSLQLPLPLPLPYVALPLMLSTFLS